MSEEKVIETPRTEMLRLVALIGRDDDVAMCAVQAVVDLLTAAGVFTEQEFYQAASARMHDQLKVKPRKVING